MVYAATRNTLTKSLGAAHFTDNLFATSKEDVTSEAYAKHKKHLAAPKPMSAREKEMEQVKAAEREAGGRSYEGSRARTSHVGERLAMEWAPEAEEAIKELGLADDSRLVVFVSPFRTSDRSFPQRFLQHIDPATEGVQLASAAQVDVSQLASSLPTLDACVYISYNLST